MSVFVGKFRLPSREETYYNAPCAEEVQLMRNAGLDPTDWLVVRTVDNLPFMLLQRRGPTVMRAAIWRG